MTDEDRNFYRKRMKEELEKATTLDDPGLRYLHAQWAKLYEARLNGIRHQFERQNLHLVETA